MALQHLRSSTANKRPTPASMSDGQLAINTNDGSPGLFFKDSNGALVKVGPVHVGTTAPNASPAVGGQAGNSKGELWLDTSGTNPVLKIWDGSAWQSEAGEFVNVSGDTMTGTLTIDDASFVVQGDSYRTVTLKRFNSSNAGQLDILLKKARGTKASPSAVQVSDNLGRIAWTGFDGTNDIEAASIQGTVDGTPGTNDMPGRISFATTSDGASSPTERVRIDSSGRLGIGTTPVVDLDVAPATSTATFRIHARSNTTSIPAIELVRGTNTTFGADAYGDYRIKNDTGSLAFEYGDAGVTTERVRIDSSGRLLVGTSTALTSGGLNGLLNVASNSTTTRDATFSYFANNAFAPFLTLAKSRSGTVGTYTYPTSGDLLGTLSFAGANTDLGRFSPGVRIDAYANQTWTSTAQGSYVVFSTTADGAASPTERMRIDNAGNVYIGNPAGGVNPYLGFRRTSDGASIASISLDGDLILSHAGGSSGVRVQLDAGTPGNFTVYNTTTERFRITGAGATYFPGVGTTASAANTFLNSASTPANQLLRSTSSLRYKTGVENLDHARADAILDFRPVWYRSKAEADRKDWSWYGLIAEEVAEIEPRLVHWSYLDNSYEEIDGERQLKPDAEMVPDGVQYDRLTVLLLDVVQRQQKAIETLEAKVAALEAV